MKSIISGIVDLIVEKNRECLFGLAAVTICAAAFLPRLKIDNALEVWFLKDDPVLVNYTEFKQIYGNDEVVAVWVKPSSGIYDREFIRKIYDVSKKLKTSPLIRRVLSITSAPYIDSINNELIVEDIVDKYPDETFRPSELKSRIEFTPLWRRLMLNRDGSAIIVMVEPVVSDDMDVRRPEILDFISTCFNGLKFKMAGMGVIYNELNRISMRDSSVFTSLAYFLLIVTIYVLFRNRRVLAASVATMIVSTLLFAGIFCMFGQKFNMISAILPSMVVVLCLEDVIYIFSTYFDTPPGHDRLKQALQHIIVPCFFTSFTTAIGFLSFFSSPMAILKTFGVFAAIGVMLELGVAFIICSFILARMEKKWGSAIGMNYSAGENAMGPVYRLLGWINAINLRHHKKIFFLGIAMLAVSIFFAARISVDTYTIGFLLDSNSVKQNSQFIENDYGFYLPLEVRLRPGNSGGINDPKFLKKLDKLQRVLENDVQIEKATSIVDVVKQLNRVLTDRKESSYEIPGTRNAVAQELLLYEMDENNDLAYLVTSDYSELRLTMRLPMVSSQDIKKIMDRVENLTSETFGDRAKLVFGGYIPLYVKLIDYIGRSQVLSFALAFFLIFLSTGILFRSWFLYAVTVIPNIVPIMMTLGIMGASGIDLDIATVTIAALTIGLSVDNTIQYLHAYRKKIWEGASRNEAVSGSLVTTGKPMFISNAILILGFSVMVFSSVKSVIYFGLLIGLTMIFATICDLFLLPSLLLYFKRKK